MAYKGKIDQVKEYESKEGYAKYAPLYKKDQNFLNTFDQKIFLREVRDLSGLKILDAGCGDGRLVPLLKKRGAADVTGIDISEEMLAEARKLGFYKDLLVEDIRQEMSFDWDTFDAVFCTLVIVHVSERDLLKVFDELFRILKPGGTLYLGNIAQRRAPMLESNGEKFYIKSYQHSDKNVIQYLEQAGFIDIRVSSQQEEGVLIASLIVAKKEV